MIVVCEGCEKKFNVDDRLIKSTGSKVRCSNCRHEFKVYPPAAALEAEEPLVLSDPVPAGTAVSEKAGLQEIDSRLDALFGEEAASAAARAPGETDPELLDVDDLLAEDIPTAAEMKPKALGDDLDLDLDLGLSLEGDHVADAPAGKPAAAAKASAAGRDDQLIDFSLEMEPPGEAAAEDALPSLDDLELDLKDVGRGEQTADAAGDTREGAELELDLDLQEFASPGAADSHAAKQPEASPADSSEDELDLSDLEAMLEGDGPVPAAKGSGRPAGADIELDLAAAVSDDQKPEAMAELDLSGFVGEPPEASAQAVKADTSAAGLDLELPGEAESAPAPAAAAPVQAKADELDFSDISGILGKAEPAGAKAGQEAPLDLDLDFSDAQPAAAPVQTPASGTADDLMLDLETLLEEDEEKPAAAQKKPGQPTEDLELDFATEPARPEAGELEIEIEPVRDEVTDKDLISMPAAPVAAGVALAAGGLAAAKSAVASGKRAAAAEITGATDVLEPEAAAVAADEPEAEEAFVPKRSGARKLLLTVMGVLVLAVAALVVPRILGIHIPYLSDLDIDIPFLGNIFQSEPEDTAGILKLVPVRESVTAEFVENSGAGRLCVIKGQITNGYDHPRSFIQVTAKLYTRDKTVAKTATVFAGTVISGPELVSQDLAALNARLKNKNGANNQNVGVKAGKSVPFMVVFDKLPNNLDEYSVEAAGSAK